MRAFARAAKSHGLLFCPIRDKMNPDHIEIAILQDDASKANRIIDKLQLAVVDTGTAELIDTVQQERGETAPETERVQTEDGAVDFEVGADEEQFNMAFSAGLGERQSVRAFLRQQQIFCKLAVAARRSASGQG